LIDLKMAGKRKGQRSGRSAIAAHAAVFAIELLSTPSAFVKAGVKFAFYFRRYGQCKGSSQGGEEID